MPTTAIRRPWRISSPRWCATGPKLTVRLLLWDYSVLYANERELFPQRHAGLEHARPGPALRSTTPCRSAPRSIRSWSSSTMRWRFPAASISPSGAGTRRTACAGQSAGASIRPASPTVRSTTCRPWWTGRRRARSAAWRGRAGCARPASGSQATRSPAIRWPDSVAPDFVDVRRRYRPHPAALRGARRRCAKSSGCFSTRSMPPSGRSISKTSSSPAPRSRSAWRSACASGRRSRRS